jgi:hypothetical protein
MFYFSNLPSPRFLFKDMMYSDDVRSEVCKGIYRLKLQVFCFGNTKDKFVWYTIELIEKKWYLWTIGRFAKRYLHPLFRVFMSIMDFRTKSYIELDNFSLCFVTCINVYKLHLKR